MEVSTLSDERNNEEYFWEINWIPSQRVAENVHIKCALLPIIRMRATGIYLQRVLYKMEQMSVPTVTDVRLWPSVTIVAHVINEIVHEKGEL